MKQTKDHGPDIRLTQAQVDLLEHYALPHIKKPIDHCTAADAAQLIAAGLIREGMGYAINPFGKNLAKITGSETAEEIEALYSPQMTEAKGWIVTEKAIYHITTSVEPEHRAQLEAVIRVFIADKDPAA